MSVACCGLTQQNIYFAIGKMQTNTDTPQLFIATQPGGLFCWYRYLVRGI